MWTAAAIIVPLALAACMGDGDPDRAAEPKDGADTTVFALLADRTLVQIDAANGKLVRRTPVGPETPIAGLGRFLALSADGRRLFALTPIAPDTPQEVTIFDSRSLRPLDRIPLERGIVFRNIALGPRSGRLYLFGNRPEREGAEDAVVALVETDGGTARTRTIREAEGHDWWVIDGAVTDDESRLFISYHGGCDVVERLCTSGADWVDIIGDRLVRCKRPSASGFGCLVRVHGGVEPLNGDLLAATGGPRLLEISKAGAITARLQTRLAGNHVMEFALDALGERAFALGSCNYTGGVSVLDLVSKRTRVLTPTLCGERIAVGGDLVAVAEQYGATPLGAPADIALIDAQTGSTRDVHVPIETVDILVVPPD